MDFNENWNLKGVVVVFGFCSEEGVCCNKGWVGVVDGFFVL